MDLNRIWTPFDKCIHFEPNLVVVVDSYLSSDRALKNIAQHWCLKFGLDRNFNPAYIAAASMGDVKTMQMLFPYIQACWEDQEGVQEMVDMALAKATKWNQLSTVKYLIQQVNANITRRAVMWSANRGHFDIVKYFWDQQDVDLNSFISIAVCAATQNNHVQVLRYLVSQTNDMDYFLIQRAFECACMFGSVDSAKYLVSLGANPTINNNEPLDVACVNNREKMVEYLVSLGVKVVHLNCLQAIRNNNLKMLKHLLPSYKAICHEEMQYYILMAEKNEQLDIVQYLLSVINDQ